MKLKRANISIKLSAYSICKLFLKNGKDNYFLAHLPEKPSLCVANKIFTGLPLFSQLSVTKPVTAAIQLLLFALHSTTSADISGPRQVAQRGSHAQSKGLAAVFACPHYSHSIHFFGWATKPRLQIRLRQLLETLVGSFSPQSTEKLNTGIAWVY